MARTCVTAPYTADWNNVNKEIEQFLESEGFAKKTIQGEDCWKKGTGLATAMQYLKIDFAENEVQIYGWIQTGVGDLAGKERDLTGIVGLIPKRKLLGRMNTLADKIRALR